MKTLYFDLETQRSAQEVGGWRNINLLRMSVGVTYCEETGAYSVFLERDVERLVEELFSADLVIGFNVIRFDYVVLGYYTTRDFSEITTLDMLDYLKRRYNFLISLEKIAQSSVGAGKSAHGLMALEWFRKGEMDKIIDYCKQDVAVTRLVYLYGKKHGSLLLPGFMGRPRRIDVDW
ncbi:helicase [bacterium]|nr:helicase [candidate division CSSED10-310 bacterium]